MCMVVFCACWTLRGLSTTRILKTISSPKGKCCCARNDEVVDSNLINCCNSRKKLHRTHTQFISWRNTNVPINRSVFEPFFSTLFNDNNSKHSNRTSDFAWKRPLNINMGNVVLETRMNSGDGDLLTDLLADRRCNRPTSCRGSISYWLTSLRKISGVSLDCQKGP